MSSDDRLITPRSAAAASDVAFVATAPDLDDVIACHWVVAWDQRGAAPLSQPVLSDPSVNLVVGPEGIRVHGPVSGRTAHVLTGAGMVVGTKFRPGAFSAFADRPIRSLTDAVLDVADLWPEQGQQLFADLSPAGAPDVVVARVSSSLRALRRAPDPGRDLAMRAVRAFSDADPDTRVSALAARVGVSQRTLQRLFAQHVGLTPKTVLKQFRFQRAVDAFERDPGIGLARLAAELGYVDQAHLTRDLGTVLGRGPGAYARDLRTAA